MLLKTTDITSPTQRWGEEIEMKKKKVGGWRKLSGNRKFYGPEGFQAVTVRRTFQGKVLGEVGKVMGSGPLEYAAVHSPCLCPKYCY